MDEHILYVPAKPVGVMNAVYSFVELTGNQVENCLFATPPNFYEPDTISVAMWVWHPDELAPEMKGFYQIQMPNDDEAELPEPEWIEFDRNPQPKREEILQAIRCHIIELPPDKVKVILTCNDERAKNYCAQLVQELDRIWPGSWRREHEPTKEKRGPKVGTFERVKEAHRLITKAHMTPRQALKQAKTDSRTYYEHCKAATGEDPVLPYE